jgi:epoxide hydrolase
MRIQPFHVSIPQSALDDLQDRLIRARWPDELPGVGWRYGVPKNYVRRLADYWRAGYNWRAWEANLNSYPQFTTEIDGQNIHFLHVRSPEPDALPLILTHGWPGSVFEYFRVIELLTKPRGADAGDASIYTSPIVL